MEKNFLHVEDIIADESFQAWYFRTDAVKSSQWESLMAANPSLATLVTEAREFMESLKVHETGVPEIQHKMAEQRLMKSLEAADSGPARVISMKRGRKGWWAAAAVVLISFSGILLWKKNVTPSEMVQAAYGELREKQLPDGSKVTLNANSEISYNEGWEKGAEREVWLKGEAFFQVQKTPAKSRFIVHGDRFDVIVTGTQFNVVNRHDKTNVMLTEGSVTIKTNDGKEIHMLPGDFVEINNLQPEKKAVQEEIILAWRDKKLIFDNTPMREAVKKIEEHYGVTFTLEDESIGNTPISGMLPNDNLDVVLAALEALSEFRMVRNDKNIVISNR